MKPPSAYTVAAVLTTIGLLAFAAACGGKSTSRSTTPAPSVPCTSLAGLFVQSTADPTETPTVGDSLTKAPTATVGSAVLFDLRNGAATRLDLANYYDAAWIDDRNAVLAFDPEAKVEAAIDLRGNIIYEVVKFDEKTPADDGAGFVMPYVVHDGRSLAIERFVARGVAPSFQLVDVFDGSTVDLSGSYYPEFSPDGQSVVGFSLDQSNESTDRASATVTAAVVAKDCGRDRPFSCVAWHPEVLDSPRIKKINGSARWSVDAAYVFFRLGEPCPEPPQRGSGCLNRSSLTVEVYDARTHDLVLTQQLPSAQSKVQWAGHNLVVDSGANPPSDRWQLIGLDGKVVLLPASLKGQTWFSPDGQYAVSWISDPFTERRCALLEAATGREIASVSGLPRLRRGQEMCRHVSWTRDGSYALVTDGNDDRDD